MVKVHLAARARTAVALSRAHQICKSTQASPQTRKGPSRHVLTMTLRSGHPGPGKRRNDEGDKWDDLKKMKENGEK
jgi:hypothetical protein